MSKIEVNAIEPQCGTTLTVGAVGTTVAVPSNVVKSNALQAADAGNIISQSGTAITLGASGDSINLASGATQSGFGRTGTVDWDTTPKTVTFSAVNGNGYFCNTTAAILTVNLPAGSAGNIVSLSDYAATWQTNNVTVTPNGTDKIGSVNTSVTLNTEGQSVTFVFVDSTQGWINTMDSTSNVRAAFHYVTATVSGACNTLATAPCCANVKIATFLGPGTFCVSCAGGAGGSNTVDYLVVAGGGGSGYYYGGGGGAGGYRFSNGTASGCYTAGPAPLAASALPVSVQGYPITTGGGGVSFAAVAPFALATGGSGTQSVFSTITSTGGGGSQGSCVSSVVGIPGGSGGGAGGPGTGASGGTGNTPPVSPPQGNPGNPDTVVCAGAGGGGSGGTGIGISAGAGLASCITASPVFRGAGGNAGPLSTPTAEGRTAYGGAGASNSGSGAGGDGNTNNGGSGIVIIRYKFQ